MLNKVILMGRLTRDPELRSTQSGTPVASFTLAVDRSFSRSDEVDFIDIVAWNKTGEFVSKWFKKGQLVAVTGRLQVRNWTDKENNKRRTYEVVAEEAHFAERKSDAGSFGSDASFPQSSAPDRSAGSRPAAIPEDTGYSDLSGDDDELPF